MVLLYHIYPINNQLLYYNFNYLKLFSKNFEKIIVNISTDQKTLPFENAKDLLLQYITPTKIFSSQNNSLGEVLPFINLLLPEVQQETAPVFYAHAKGVSIQDTQVVPYIQRWIQTLWLENMDIKKITECLKSKHICGVLRVNHRIGNLSFVPWHYSGTFFWFNPVELFKREWKKIRMSRYGVEGYPATIFSKNESWCLKYDFPVWPNLYLAKGWKVVDSMQ